MASDEQLAKWKEEAHDKGQKDGSEGTFDPPYEGIDQTLFGRDEQQQALNDAYRAGHDNGEANPSKS